MVLHIDRRRTLEVARDYLSRKIREKSKNWDSGGPITKFLSSAGIDYPAPWCAAFCLHVIRQANGAYPWPGITSPAYVPSIWGWGVANGCAHVKAGYIPKVGDLIIFAKKDVLAHIGIVDDVSGNSVYSIEGNTGPTGGGGEGDGLYRKMHTLSSDWVYGFISLPDKEAESVPKVPDENVTIMLDGEVIAVGLIDQGRTMAPLTVLAKRLGFKVNWDAATRTATIVRG